MNKELLDKAIEINKWLLQQEAVVEFKKYDKIVKNNIQLKEKEDKLKRLQKEIVNKKHNDENCDELIQEYESLKNEFFNHPIVNNYLMLKEEVNQLIQQINSIINIEINL